mmetsp:Transcript_21767/g.34102  ORF Transcript_21767/g.34102 Transcript_21767/m.34102 type:complete len:140 (-) Transcript_21767:10-429(-)
MLSSLRTLMLGRYLGWSVAAHRSTRRGRHSLQRMRDARLSNPRACMFVPDFAEPTESALRSTLHLAVPQAHRLRCEPDTKSREAEPEAGAAGKGLQQGFASDRIPSFATNYKCPTRPASPHSTPQHQANSTRTAEQRIG